MIVNFDKTGLEIRFNLHQKRKNNIKVAGMYEAYKNGRSLEQVAGMYRISRQAVYDVFKSRGYSLRSKEMKGKVIIDGISFTLMKGGYLRGTIPGKIRTTAQRYVWEKNYGPVPDGHVIHHKNGIKTDNEISNLCLVKKSDMGKVFNPEGNNQFIKK
jgi:hypothetical protein